MKNLKLSKKQVKHIAKLSNLKLSEAEVKNFQKQLSDVLKYVEKLKKADTKNVEPTSQATGLVNIFGQDKVNEKRYIKKKDYYKTEAVF